MSPLHRRFFPNSFVLPPEITVHSTDYRPPPKKYKDPRVRCGLLFEKQVGKGLYYWAKRNKGWTYHFQYGLRNSRGEANFPDHILVGPDRVVLFETKYTYVADGNNQLLRYAALLGRHFSKPVILVQVCQNLRPGTSLCDFVTTVEGAIERTREGPFIWHLFRPRNWLFTMEPCEDLPILPPDAVFKKKRKKRQWPVTA